MNNKKIEEMKDCMMKTEQTKIIQKLLNMIADLCCDTAHAINMEHNSVQWQQVELKRLWGKYDDLIREVQNENEPKTSNRNKKRTKKDSSTAT